MLNAKGIKFLLSNSSCEFIEDLYKDYIIDHVDAKRAINVKPEKRGEIQEVLVRNYELELMINGEFYLINTGLSGKLRNMGGFTLPLTRSAKSRNRV